MIYKAQRTLKDSPAPDLLIEATREMESDLYDYESLSELAALFQEQAEQIADALCASLPGGTLDRLLGELLKCKASHFIIAAWDKNE
jgi:hypothetical protein